MKKILLIAVALIIGCTASQKKDDSAKKKNWREDAFLTESARNKDEVFRVLMTADEYIVAQKAYSDSISRTPDDSGDKYFVAEMMKFNKIDEICEGIISVWLFPDSGRLMQVRFVRSTFIRELDTMIMDDIQRWNFAFQNKRITPIKFTVRYKIVLEKRLSDEEIINDMRQNLKERTGQ